MEMMELRTLPINLSPVSADQQLKVSGYVNVTGSVSEPIRSKNALSGVFRETILPGVFQKALDEADKIEFLDSHDSKRILATTDNGSLQLHEDAKGLFMSAIISPTTWGRDTYQLISDGIIKGMSFGMIVRDVEWGTAEDGLPLRMIKEISLFEVSATRRPAYVTSSVETRGLQEVEDVEVPETREKGDLNLAEKKIAKKVQPKDEPDETASAVDPEPKATESDKKEQPDTVKESKATEKRDDGDDTSDDQPDLSDVPDDTSTDTDSEDRDISGDGGATFADVVAGLAQLTNTIQALAELVSESSDLGSDDEDDSDDQEDRSQPEESTEERELRSFFDGVNQQIDTKKENH